ncbi:MAG: universal stress protein, partial [Nitrososphaera sp.]
DLKRKDFRILIPYTPENPDRLIKYAIRVAKETSGEVNILRVITVPHQTPLSAGAAFADSARRSFEPLEKMLDKEDVINHYLVRVSHDATEAVLATIEEQKIDLLVTDFETLRNDRKLRTIMTCDVLGVRAEDDSLELEQVGELINAEQSSEALPSADKKNMVVIYDGGEHSALVLKTTSWLEHSGRFRVNLLSVNPRGATDRTDGRSPEHQDYLSQLGVELKEIQLDPENSGLSADAVLRTAGAFNPDIVIMGASVGGFSVFNNIDFFAMLDQLNCPVVIARSFTIPGVHQAKSILLRLFKK